MSSRGLGQVFARGIFTVTARPQAAALLVAAALTTACGTETPGAHPSLGNRSGADADKAGTDAGSPDGSGGGADAGDSGAEPVGDFTGCNFEPGDTAALLADSAFNGLPLTLSGTRSVLGISLPFDMTATPALTMKTTPGLSVTTTTLTAVAGNKAAQKNADDEAALHSGTVQAELVPAAAWAGLKAKSPSWDGTRCLVLPALKLTAAFGSGNVVATFDPPLPVGLSPAADAGLYAEALAAPKTFTAVSVTVSSSTDPAVPAGTHLTGTVTISPLPPTYNATLSDGRTVTVGGDVAYEVRSDFGSPAAQAALGIPPVARYFIDTTKHAFKAVVADTALTGAPVFVLIAK